MAVFTIVNDQVLLSTDAVEAADTFSNGLLLRSSDGAARAVDSSGDEYANGLLMTDVGQVAFVDATSSLPADTVWSNGLPRSGGRLCVANAVAAYWSNGIPFAANGAVSALYFSPASLFTAGEQGAWYDPSDFSTMFQDSAGSVPVTAVEQPVGLLLDKSGRGNHATQSTAASRPVLSARVNLLTKTEQFDDAAWGKTRSSIAANATAAPDGLVTADKFIEDTTASNTHSVSGPIITLPSASTATVTVYVKAAERVWCRVANAGVVSGGAFVNLATGQFGTIEAGVTASSIQDVGNGWYRVSITGVLASTAAQLLVQLSTGNGNASYTGDGTSGIFIWGADLRVANSGANLPVYQRVNTATDYDTTGFPLYLAFDGVDDGMVTSSINFSATDKMTVVAGVRKLSDAAIATLVELSASIVANNGSIYVRAPASAGANFGWASKGTTLVGIASPNTFAAPITSVLTGIGDVSGDSAILRVNGTQVASSSADQGTGNYGNYPLFIGRRGGTTLPFNGRLYGLIVRGAASTAQQITQAESWMNQRTRAF